MTIENELKRYERMLEAVGPRRIRELELSEAGFFEGGRSESEVMGQCFTVLDIREQAEIVRALDMNLEPVKQVDRCGPTSYAIKHAAERMAGFYVSNLQAKVALRLLGYKRGLDDDDRLYPKYNISRVSWRSFDELSRDIDRYGRGM